MKGIDVNPGVELDDLVEEIKRLRKEARGTHPGIARERLLRQAKQAEAVLEMRKRANSPGLQSPE
ncbi:hypothetical protein UP10_28560 [Bradyrhizobium sp. LTSPM299]|jgi:hypothetical protein|uniref:hypothetical protein n=1 Tax=Bradyrhizobium sp. LTSPM299 TaxID=1619233 RepID=UPI0005C86C9B|nr:hypothetical protein [Bradyrhizobium sp. LTSPM299]KJC57531.1 hypothetical protein UP10_28560 [Bradyrhizobium sp. LTSPM299]